LPPSGAPGTPALPPAPTPDGSAGRAVIDTNVWLDLYLYDDPGAQALAHALAQGRLQALRTPGTDDELQRVLARPVFAQRLGRRVPGADPVAAAQGLIQRWQNIAIEMAQRGACALVCRDPDDQKFLDLACGAGAAWLFTKDRALLSLAAKARRAGLAIVVPSAYRPDARQDGIGYR